MDLRRLQRLSVVLLAPLAGCNATVNAPPPITDISTRQCGAAFDLSKPAPVTFDGQKEWTVDTDINETTPCIAAAGGSAVYTTFQLPQISTPYVISVMSLVEGSTVFVPRVLLLGGDGGVRREFSGQALQFRGTGLGAVLRSHPDETYLVVESDPSMVGKTDSRIADETQVYTVSSGYGAYQVHTGTETHPTFTYSHNGRIEITLTPLKPAWE